MHTIRRENNMEQHTGYLGNSRVVLNHYDVSTQADIQHIALSYESEDELMARLHRPRRPAAGPPHYSKQDIREQYCISPRGLGALDAPAPSLFGCLSAHRDSPCARAGLLGACVRRQRSDERLHECGAPYPRRARYPWAPLADDVYRYDAELKSSYFRRKMAAADPSRYEWMLADDEAVRMEMPRSILEQHRGGVSPPPAASKKHVSFARSHTMASFDEASLSSSSSHLNRMTRSQERLLDVRKTEIGPITRQPEPSDNLLIIDKVKRAPMKTQATQTEACLGRKPLPPANINLSPRTIHRVKMVSQGAQTNGFLQNGRKLQKSYSEVAGTKFDFDTTAPAPPTDHHSPLHRTQSDEPPRSPFVLPSPPILLSPPPNPLEALASDTSSLSHESDESESKREIFIDFKPQVSPTALKRRPLTKTASDGEILLERRTSGQPAEEKAVVGSLSHEHIMAVDLEGVAGEGVARDGHFRPYFQKSPIRYEGICRPLTETAFSSFDENGGMQTQDSIDEEFHENLIYNRMLMQEEEDEEEEEEEVEEEDEIYSPNDECVVPSVCLLPGNLSPFASNDSLANDVRDHSDGIWNESQATVLQADSGTDNGTAVSSSEMASITSPGAAIILTPSSRRKHLLMMQHQQRSSMDTEALDEEFIEQTETSPRIIIEKPKLAPPPTKYLRPISPFRWRHKRPLPHPPTPPPAAAQPPSPLPAIVPDLLLARTDSAKTNTDLSESTTTTEDYITANSGTDSSRTTLLRSAALLPADDMVVPSLAPPPPTGRSSPTDSSSSCGSYTVDGSCPDLLSGKVPSKHHHHHQQIHQPNDKRRPFTLEITKPCRSETVAGLSPEKPKRAKTRTRSPLKRHQPGDDPRRMTSDESSCDRPHLSPRRARKAKEGGRRKSLPRSPTVAAGGRQPPPEKPSSSLPGSLSRRKSSKRAEAGEADRPRKSPDKLKAASAESLRSVSPGSDSVFYSDPSSAGQGGDHQVHCLHCGKEVDIVTTDEVGKRGEGEEEGGGGEVGRWGEGGGQRKEVSEGVGEIVVQPPAGFEDSPRMKQHARLYKKLDRRFRSEDRTQVEHRKHRYKPDARAKSEERGAKTYRGKLRPMAKSTTSSQEELKTTDSSPSVLPGAPENEDDQGVYDVPYLDGSWIYIDEREEVQKNQTPTSEHEQQARRSSISSTESEQEFRKRYQAVTHRMVHRKSCLEMYKRQTSKSFADQGLNEDDNNSELRNKLEEILKLMLVIWCRENQALKLINPEINNECDKTVIVHRESGEFGFRIHGSKPVVVSAIEPGTPAETSGLEVGDIVLAVNGVSVLDKSHSEVVKIAHAGSDTLSLEVARTCYAVNPNETSQQNTEPLFSGYLWKLSGYASGNLSNKWIRRWFCLKANNCLYYYKTDAEKQPVGVVMLYNHEIRRQSNDENGFVKPHRFIIAKCDSTPLHLAADSQQAENRWIEVVGRAIAACQCVDALLEETKRNLTAAPCAIPTPDCFGYLVKLGTQWKAWNKRYCVLKDACLYFYQEANAKSAFGVAYLQGYRVQQSISGSKKHAFEIIPPDGSKKHYYFHTESDADRKRWIAALEYSIDRWLKV